MKKLFLTAFFSGSVLFGQTSEYKFTHLIDLNPTSTMNQGKTGTCWSFATISFLEVEVYRINNKFVDLSKMYSVRESYPRKAYNYVYRQGKAQFDEGGLGHDVINIVADIGLVPAEAYTGKMGDSASQFDHSELIKILKEQVDGIVKNPKENMKPDWMKTFNQTLDKYMGAVPEKFTYEGAEYTPQSFAKALNIHAEDYVTLTSFTHHPPYSKFILEIPDNYANGSYYNLPLDEYFDVLVAAVFNGYTVALDTDVSEKSFSAQEGLAIWPSEGGEEHYFKALLPEKMVTAEERQAAFEDYSTMDDHLMHITGIVRDQIGNRYFDVKNSWGTKGFANNGHVYMSFPYIRMKSIAYTLHKDALPKELREKLGI